MTTHEEMLQARIEIEQQLDVTLGRNRIYVNPAETKPVPQRKYVRPASMMTLLRDVAALPTDEEKIERLKGNRHSSLIAVLRADTDPEVTWTVVERPNFSPAGHFQHNYLFDTARRLYLFTEMPGGRASPVANDAIKRNDLWRRFLEEHAADECDLLLMARKKMLLQSLGIPLRVIHQAFPELQANSDAAIREEADAPRRNASRNAQDRMIVAVQEQQEVLRQTQVELEQAGQTIKRAMSARDYAARKLSFLKSELGKLGN